MLFSRLQNELKVLHSPDYHEFWSVEHNNLNQIQITFRDKLLPLLEISFPPQYPFEPARFTLLYPPTRKGKQALLHSPCICYTPNLQQAHVSFFSQPQHWSPSVHLGSYVMNIYSELLRLVD